MLFRSGFPLAVADDVHETPPPTAAQLQLIREVLDPHDVRAGALR